MQIETLKVFCDLVESHSFSQAAVRNFITQSAVSQQIRGLEARFETPLFVREGRAISLTPRAASCTRAPASSWNGSARSSSR